MEALWTITDCAAFLKKSKRWLWNQLARRPEDPGSIPHFRIGSTPRFMPEVIRQWLLDGCPPAADFKEWNKKGR